MARLRAAGRVLAFVCSAALFAAPAASAGERDRKLARAVADYLISARAVIADNQDLINNAAKGRDRFTPQVYEELVRREFRARSNVDIRSLKASTTDVYASSLLALHQSAMEVISQLQQRINAPGAGFKGVHPAVVGALIGQELYKRSDIRIKQTSLKYRASYNKPDDLEANVLRTFATATNAAPYYAESTVDGKRRARYLAPLYITKACLVCHGDPAGELDVTGRAKEGYKEGMLRGAISVIVPIR